MAWTKRVQHPSEIVKKGDKVKIKILKVDHENRRISLGLKQLEEDPWPEIANKYAIGTDSLGHVMKILDRGLIVELDGDVEGFVPIAQLGHDNLRDATGVFKEGEEVPVQVIEFDKTQHKIVLSISKYYESRDTAELDEFLSKHPVGEKQSMADAMPEELKKVVAEAPVAEEPPAEEPAPEEEAKAEVSEDETETEAESTPEADDSEKPKED